MGWGAGEGVVGTQSLGLQCPGPQGLGSKPPGDERGSKPHSEAVRRRSPCLAGALGSKP